MPAFLDTGYLIALEAADDQHHADAIRHWREFLRNRHELVTTSFVLDEVVTYFVSRGRHAKAIEIAERLLGSPSVRVIHMDEDIFLTAFDYLRRRPDKRYSLTECVSFVTMGRLGLRQALAFDTHFAQAGFTIVPAVSA
jgi:predicted nucleic acid-binding protein